MPEGAGTLRGKEIRPVGSGRVREGADTVKVRNSLRSMKSMPGAQVVRRGRRVFVLNRRNPRYTTRQG
jgi:large subunit ribosomal protein L36